MSYIVYLTDPDDAWAASDGGALELYPLAPGGGAVPDVAPTVAHLPLWNSMAMFVVQPGRSYHSVQEVRASPLAACRWIGMAALGFWAGWCLSRSVLLERGSLSSVRPAQRPTTTAQTQATNKHTKHTKQSINPPATTTTTITKQKQVLTDDKPRFSISGWYHAPAEPEGRDAASLRQLQAAPGQDCVKDHAPFEGGDADCDLDEAELALLRRWVSPAYLEPAAWAKVSALLYVCFVCFWQGVNKPPPPLPPASCLCSVFLPHYSTHNIAKHHTKTPHKNIHKPHKTNNRSRRSLRPTAACSCSAS